MHECASDDDECGTIIESEQQKEEESESRDDDNEFCGNREQKTAALCRSVHSIYSDGKYLNDLVGVGQGDGGHEL